MTNTNKRVLFFAETVTLAHIARCVVIAKALYATSNYNIALAADNRFDSVIGELPFARFALNSISCKQFALKLKKGSPVYSSSELTGYVNDDLSIIDEFQPDFIFGDFRLSLAISARMRQIPYATITNAYWSQHADITYPIPEMPLTRVVGVPVAQKIFDLVRPLAFSLHTLAFNFTCKKFNFPSLGFDLRRVYTEADYTLYADIESLIPMKTLPSSHHFIGPILWSAAVSKPLWWDQLPSNRPIVFVTMGSSGDSSLLSMILNTLSSMNLTVVCATAGKTTINMHNSNVFISDFLPVDMLVKKADIVICNGGSPMVYQSITEKTFVIGLPSNLDQYLMMTLAHVAGYGDLIRSGMVDANKIRNAVENALKNYSPNSKELNHPLEIDKIISLIEHS